MDDSTLPALADMLPVPAALDAILAAANADRPTPAIETVTDLSYTASPDREPWAGITDDDVAEWAMAKLSAITSRVDAMKAHADHLMAQIDNWFHGEMERRQGEWPSLRDQLAFFSSHLEAYARAQRDEKDRKTIPLVSGDVATREQKARLEVEDEGAFVAWAKEHAPTMVRIKFGVVKSEVNAAFDGSALIAPQDSSEDPPCWFAIEDVPGVAIEPAHVTVTVKPR